MDNDNFNPLKIRGSQILGLKKLAANAIETEGIRLKAQEFSEKPPTAVNKISWLRPVNSKIASTLWSLYLSGGLSRLWLETFAFTFSTEAEEYYAKLKIQASANPGAENGSEIRAQVKGLSGTQDRLVIDHQGNSGWLKILGTNNRTIAFGTATMTQVAGTNFLTALKVNHGLASTATVCVASSDNAAITIAAVPNASATQIELRGYNAFGTEGLTTNVRWIAIA